MRDIDFTHLAGYESCLSMRAGDEFDEKTTQSTVSSAWIWARRVLPPVGTKQVGYVHVRHVVEVGTVVGDVPAGEQAVAALVAVAVSCAPHPKLDHPHRPAELASSSPQSPSQGSHNPVSSVSWHVWCDGSNDDKRGFACSCVVKVASPGLSRDTCDLQRYLCSGISRDTCAVAGFFIGSATSELAGLILSLQTLEKHWTQELRARASVADSVSPVLTVTISTDSSRVVEYLSGDQPKTESGRKLWYIIQFARATKARLQQLGMLIDIIWISRQDNAEANQLAKARLRRARDHENWDPKLLAGAGASCFSDDAVQALARTEFATWVVEGNGWECQHSATRLGNFM